MLQDPNDELLKLTFYATPSHKCSYLPEQQATTVFLDPEKHISKRLYTRLSETGFRRSGSHIYRPHCEACQSCVPVRIPVAEFIPNKNQKRCARVGATFSVDFEPAAFSEEHYQVYERYLYERHADGDMFPPSEQQYKEFLLCEWSNTHFMTFRDNGRLVGCSVIDILDSGLSAVYTYFNPDYSAYSPGRLAILKMVEKANSMDLDYVYLGYMVKNCKKMQYKLEYRPLDCLVGHRWIRLR